MTSAHWISDGTEATAVPLRVAQPRRTWRFGRYEIGRFPRQGRWSAAASPMTGVAGYRTLIGAVLAARRVARREPVGRRPDDHDCLDDIDLEPAEPQAGSEGETT